MCAVVVFAAAAAAASLSRHACLCVSHVACVSFLVRLHPSESVTTSSCTFSTRSSLPLSCQRLAASGGQLGRSLLSHTRNRLYHEASEPTSRNAAIGSDPLADTTAISRTTAVAAGPHAAAPKKLLITSAPTRFIGREAAAARVQGRHTVEPAGLPGTGTEAAAVRFSVLRTVEARPPTTQRPPPAAGLAANRQQPPAAEAHTTGERRRTGERKSKTAVKDRTAPEAGSPAEGAAPGWTVVACCRGPVAAEAAEAGDAAPAPAQGLAGALGKTAAPATSRAAAQKTQIASSYKLAWIRNKKGDTMDGETIQPVKAAEPPVIGTHSGTFHADEVLATVMLLSLPEYKDAKLLRSRDPAALAVCNVVVDVGAEYCVATRRFDHHQKSFTTTFYDDENKQDAAAAEVPAAATPAAAGATTGGEREAAGQGAPDMRGETRINTLGDTRREERIDRARHAHETKDIDKETNRARQDGDTGNENVQPAAGRAADAAEKERKNQKSEGESEEGKLALFEDGKGETAAATGAAQPRAVTKLSSAGLIYKHFGKRVLQHRYGICDKDRLETVYQRLYRTFVEAVDAIDNGVSVVPGGGPLAYRDTTNLSSRIGNCNPPWNCEFLRQKYPDDPLYNPEKTSLYPVEIQGGDPDGNAGFRKAMQLAAEALDAAARGILDVWLPARDIVTAAVRERYTVHPSGRMIKLKQWCPFEDHVFLLEKEINVKPPLLYCLYPDRRDGKEVGWRIRAIGIEGHMLESRLPLSSRFRGLRGSELGSVVCRACKEELVNVNIESDEFIHCHATGFIAGTTTLDAAIALGALTIEEAACAGSDPS